jgi:hypothetical protein
MSTTPSEVPDRRRVVYDAVDGIIEVDLTNLHATAADIDVVFDGITALASGLPKPPYVLVCWLGASLEGQAPRRYGERIATLSRHVRAIVRYQMVDSMTRVVVRTETIKRRLQNSRAFIFETRQDALRAIRSGIIDEQLRQPGER